jgi:diguanylate cyclase (GGDEF)-like protein
MSLDVLATVGCGLGVAGGFGLLAAAELRQKVVKLNAALWREQRTDPMTGLRNRRALVDELAIRQAQGGAWSLVRFDLDKFKLVNDTHGHAAGDLVLCEFARRLEASSGEHTLVARIHGDEFAMVVPVAADAAVPLMEGIARQVAQPLRLMSGVRISIRTSIGVAAGSGDVDPETLMHRADLAVYGSKRTGRPVVWKPVRAAAVERPFRTAPSSFLVRGVAA